MTRRELALAARLVAFGGPVMDVDQLAKVLGEAGAPP